MTASCGHDDDLLVLHAVCHITAPTWVWLNRKKNTAEVRCSVCEKLVVTLELAELAVEAPKPGN